KVIAGADGAGGHDSGEVASSAFLQGIHARVAERAWEGKLPQAKELFEEGRKAVDLQVYLPERAHEKGATGTGAVIVIVGNQAMIATAGDALVVLSRRQADGTYQSEGYSNADSIPPHVITNGIHVKMPKQDKDMSDPNEDPFSYAREARLYGVKDLKPGDRFLVGSDGLYNNLI